MHPRGFTIPPAVLLIPGLLLTFSKVLDTLSDHRIADINDSKQQ